MILLLTFVLSCIIIQIMIVRFDFEQDKTNNNPQLLYFINDECKYEYDKNKTFTHNIAELCYVTNGKGHLHVEKEDYLISRNDIYMINPYTSHGEYVEKGQGFSYYILGICNFSISSSIKPEQPRKLSGNNKIPLILDYVFNEQIQAADGYAELTDELFKILLIEIERLYKTKIENSDSSQENIAMRIKKYIDANYLGDCSSKTVADFFNKKLNTIEIKFKKQFGISMQQYILKLKIETAKKHLQSNNMSVRDLAINCGFYNSSYFTQYFKKIVGLTPTEYKKQLTAEKKS